MSKSIGEMNELDCLRWLVAVAGGPSGPSGGGSSSPVSGIQELRPAAAATSGLSGNNTIPAGALSVLVLLSSDFVGAVNGLPVLGSDRSYRDSSKPGNTLPAIPITSSAGTYSYAVGRAS